MFFAAHFCRQEKTISRAGIVSAGARCLRSVVLSPLPGFSVDVVDRNFRRLNPFRFDAQLCQQFPCFRFDITVFQITPARLREIDSSWEQAARLPLIVLPTDESACAFAKFMHSTARKKAKIEKVASGRFICCSVCLKLARRCRARQVFQSFLISRCFFDCWRRKAVSLRRTSSQTGCASVSLPPA